MKVRVCDLKVGDEFEETGLDYRVFAIEGGQVWYQKMSWNWNGRKYASGHRFSIGAQSQKFVNLTNGINRDHKKRPPPDPEIVGPGPG